MTLALIDGNMRRELQGNMAVRAPDYFFIDIQSRDLAGFEDVVKRAPQCQAGRSADVARDVSPP